MLYCAYDLAHNLRGLRFTKATLFAYKRSKVTIWTVLSDKVAVSKCTVYIEQFDYVGVVESSHYFDLVF